MRILEQVKWLKEHEHPAWLTTGTRSRILDQEKKMGLPCAAVEFRGSANPMVLQTLLQNVEQQA